MRHDTVMLDLLNFT